MQHPCQYKCSGCETLRENAQGWRKHLRKCDTHTHILTFQFLELRCYVILETNVSTVLVVSPFGVEPRGFFFCFSCTRYKKWKFVIFNDKDFFLNNLLLFFQQNLPLTDFNLLSHFVVEHVDSFTYITVCCDTCWLVICIYHLSWNVLSFSINIKSTRFTTNALLL